MRNEKVVMVTRDFYATGYTYNKGELLFNKDKYWHNYHGHCLCGVYSIDGGELIRRGIIIPATEAAKILYGEN